MTDNEKRAAEIRSIMKSVAPKEEKAAKKTAKKAKKADSEEK